jgi:hypothetical protein
MHDMRSTFYLTFVMLFDDKDKSLKISENTKHTCIGQFDTNNDLRLARDASRNKHWKKQAYGQLS